MSNKTTSETSLLSYYTFSTSLPNANSDLNVNGTFYIVKSAESAPSVSENLPASLTMVVPTGLPKKNKCFVCGCARNVAKYISAVIRNIRKLETVFDEIYVIMSYDQSDDNTLEILHSFQKEFEQFHIIINTLPLSDIRTERIANARNGILKYISILQHSNPVFREYAYFCMIDMDNICAGQMYPEIITPYLSRNDWDALSFFREEYYDIWALSIRPFVISCWHWYNYEISLSVVKAMKKYICDKRRDTPTTELIECESAFCGFGIYRLSKFIDCEYNHYMPFQYISPSMLRENERAVSMPLMPDIEKYCGDCEHRWFHMEAIQKHDAKIRISPLILFGPAPE